MSKSSTPKVSGKNGRSARRKANSKHIAEKARDKQRQVTPKVVAEKALVQRKAAKLRTAEASNTRRGMAAPFEGFLAQVPDTMRALAETNVAQTREAYERSKFTLQSVLESWQKSFGAVGQGAVAINRNIIDIAERNVDSSFVLATDLCRAKNLSEVMELQAAYWRKLLGDAQRSSSRRRRPSTY
jgi:hypothetical protein